MKPIRRKLLIDNGYKMVKLYPCWCKWGTQELAYCYLFDEPSPEIYTKAIKSKGNDKSLMNQPIYGVRITNTSLSEGDYILLEILTGYN